jgi:hypothetical protein
MILKLELSQQDAEAILKFVDIGLKAAGLAALSDAMRIKDKIDDAVQAAQAPERQEPKLAAVE